MYISPTILYVIFAILLILNVTMLVHGLLVLNIGSVVLGSIGAAFAAISINNIMRNQ